MECRRIIFVVEELKKIAPPGRLHRTTKVMIPVPRFVVFYNGTAKQPEKATCKLSELFSGEEKAPELEEAVRQAVNECISENILADFFEENREEIVEMGIYEFDQEVYDQTLREDGEAIGMEKGIKQASLVCKKVQSGETDNKVIAKSVGCTPEEVEMIRKQFGI